MQILQLWQALRRQWRPLLGVHLIFTGLGVILLTPLLGFLLRGALAMSGKSAVADQDIALLLLSPLGIVSGIVLVAALALTVALELGALMVVVQAGQRHLECSGVQAARYSLRRAPALFRLTLALVARALLYLAPFALLILAIAWFLLTDHDINYYLSERPPVFFIAVALSASLLLVAGWVLLRRLLPWCLAPPHILFNGCSASEAIRASAGLCEPQLGTVVRAYAHCVLLLVLLLLVPAALFKSAGGALVGYLYNDLGILIAVLGVLAALWLLLNILVSAAVLAAIAQVTNHLYRQFGVKPDPHYLQHEAGIGAEHERGWTSQRVLLLVVLLSVVAGTIGLWLLRGISVEDHSLVIAHRGAAGAAPENTLAAIQQAIDDGSDWVEVDVQESRDGEVVVVHDSDFMKLAGEPLKVWEGDLAQIQAIDVGSWFGPAFAAQRVPTLAQVLEVISRGQSRLVIELKYYGHDQQLEQRVVDIVEAAGMADSVVIMSLKLEGVKKMQALRPDWEVGLLAATAVGDLTRLDVDFLAVNTAIASSAFIKRAHKSGKKVLVWTVNDGLSLSRWMSRGVDGVITDEPALARDILRQRAQLSSTERLALSAALFLGRPEVAERYRDNSP